MGVVISDVDALMTQPVGNGRGREAHVNQKRYRAVPLRYNYDKPEKPRRIKGFEVFSLVFHPFPKRKITLKEVEL